MKEKIISKDTAENFTPRKARLYIDAIENIAKEVNRPDFEGYPPYKVDGSAIRSILNNLSKELTDDKY